MAFIDDMYPSVEVDDAEMFFLDLLHLGPAYGAVLDLDKMKMVLLLNGHDPCPRYYKTMRFQVNHIMHHLKDPPVFDCFKV